MQIPQTITGPAPARTWPGTSACVAACALGAAHFIVNSAGFFADAGHAAGDYLFYLVYVVGISLLCVGFGLAALGLYRRWNERIPRGVVRGITWVGCILITLLALLTIFQTVSSGELRYLTFAGPGPWSIIAGPLLGLAAWLAPTSIHTGT